MINNIFESNIRFSGNERGLGWVAAIMAPIDSLTTCRWSATPRLRAKKAARRASS
jgi:hypothetical protein